MISGRRFAALIYGLLAISAAFCAASCGGKGQGADGSGGTPSIGGLPNGPTLPTLSGPNVMQMTVNGSLCSASSGYPNKPCVAVTICAPGTTNCQTISDILVDTGSYGLRVFSSLVRVPLTQVSATDGNALVECAQFGSGSDWGPVKLADIVLGGEPPVRVPMQVIDSTYANSASLCGTPDKDPAAAGFNGILGVGLFAADCGSLCENTARNGDYFSCSGTTCAGIKTPSANQVTNPVSALPVDNNGVVVELPSVPPGGVVSSNGYLVLGIDTQSNNHPSGVVAYQADEWGEFTTNFDNGILSSFIDSGSNGLFLPPPSSGALPDCGGVNASWFCPSSLQLFSAVVTSASSSPSVNVPFLVGNANSIMRGNNNVFMELAGDSGDPSLFDWGLSFHLGRNVYVGIEGQKSSLGTGPYWAF